MMVKIVDKMSNAKFDVVCTAGVDLVNELVAVLSRHGLNPDDATNVLAVAAAGVTKGSSLSLPEFTEAIDASLEMWRLETRGEQTGVVFDPPHKRSGFIAANRTKTSDLS